MTRGLRNNNPGNIRHDEVKWKGEINGSDRSFKTFQSMEWGIRAIFHLLNNYRLLYGKDTIESLISRWAPSNENDTQAYIDTVSKLSGVPATAKITTTNKDVMIPIVSAMIRVENGSHSIPMSTLNAGWDLFLQNIRR